MVLSVYVIKSEPYFEGYDATLTIFKTCLTSETCEDPVNNFAVGIACHFSDV